jgi:hypothetical protein
LKGFWPVLLVLMASHAVAAPANEASAPRLHTIERDLAEVSKPSTLAIADPMAVFGFVLRQLPERVQVLPTENYYYFRFVHNGVPYTGNIRLGASDRDKGRVHFAYGEQPSDWLGEPAVHYVELDAAKGVDVTRIAPLTYRVAYQGRAVVFVLNDMASAKLPAHVLRPDEKLLGPIFDESGVRFFLVFNERLKVFHYLLDETVAVPDELFAAGADGAILLGKRTGFAFYQDGNRKILIGVHERNSRLTRCSMGRSTSCRKIPSRARPCAMPLSQPAPASETRSTASAISSTIPDGS